MKHAQILALVVSLALTGSMALAQKTKPFPDVPKDHWAYQAVMELKEKGILIGYPDGTFNGDGTKTAKPIYDLSSPMATWRTLLAAMRNRDEFGVQNTLAPDCHDPAGLFPKGDGSLGNLDRKAHLDTYQKRAKSWSKLHLYVNAGPTYAVSEFHDPALGPAPFGPGGPFIEFMKIGEVWKISLLWIDLE